MRKSPFILMALLLFVASGANGHELQPAYLELRQTGPETFDVLWKVPNREDLRQGIRPVFPDQCKTISEPTHLQSPDAYIERYTISCPGGLDGKEIKVTGAAAPVADVMIRFVRNDGRTQIARLNPTIPSATIEAIPSTLRQAYTFLRLGVEHILMGVDHLLFVLGLLLIVKDRRMLVKTITSFTIAHSITLAVATLGYASAPLPPLNAAIALSILFLGPEAVRKENGETSLTIRHPWVVAFAFGLLHGFGFASGLMNLGLSHSEIPLALLLFNVGVEIGQLFFVATILLLARSFRTLEIHWPRWALSLPAYSVGSLGAYWTIQRTLIMLGIIW